MKELFIKYFDPGTELNTRYTLYFLIFMLTWANKCSSSFTEWNWDSKRLSFLSKISQVESGKARIRKQIC